MMKYKKGDKVQLKSSEEIKYVSCANDKMPEWGGQIATILELTGHGSYEIDLDSQRWLWTDEMIECLVEKVDNGMKYKVGDKVRLKSKSELDNYDLDTVSEMIALGGQIATITRATSKRYCIDIDSGEYYWNDDMIKGLAKEDESEDNGMKYNVGDKVKIKESIGSLAHTVSSMSIYEGKIATITQTEVYDDGYRLDIDSGEYYWNDDMIKGLAKEDESEEIEMSILKVGDKVKINKDLSSSDFNVSCGMEEFRGDIATIVSLGNIEDDGCQKYYLDIDDGDYYWTKKMFTSSALALNFKEVVANVEEGQTYISKDGERTLTLKDGFFVTQGFDETFSLDEEFKLVTVLSLQDILKKENNYKKFKVVFANDNTEIVEVRVYGENLELEDEDEDDINENYCLSSVLNAKYFEI